MNLINELQISAERDDVLTVLRKTRRLASKLGRDDITDWLHAEQNGYTEDQPVPAYRMIRSHVAYNTNGYVPAGFGVVRNGVERVPGCDIASKFPMRDSISNVLALIQKIDPKHQIYHYVGTGSELDKLIRRFVALDPEFSHQVTFQLELKSEQIQAIPENIKDRVLEWACALEEAGVHGEGMTFSDTEKQIAHVTTFSISDSKIDQLNAHGKNEKG